MNDDDLDNPVAFHRAVLAIAVGVGLILIAGWIGICLTVGVANAHEAPSGWTYPMACCSNRDCNMIRAERVRETPQGYEITLLPGDHDFITERKTFLVSYERVKDSPDGAYHICLSPSLTVLCFFAGGRIG